MTIINKLFLLITILSISGCVTNPTIKYLHNTSYFEKLVMLKTLNIEVTQGCYYGQLYVNAPPKNEKKIMLQARKKGDYKSYCGKGKTNEEALDDAILKYMNR